MLTSLLSYDALVKLLYTTGHFDKLLGAMGFEQLKTSLAQSCGIVEQAVKSYQASHGLKVDGVVGPKTSTQLLAPRCGLGDFLMQDQTCKWPMAKVGYFSQISLPGLTDSQVAAAYDLACRQWNGVCGIQLTRVAAPATANIVSGSGVGPADGFPSTAVLGWSELPCGAQASSQMHQQFDQQENWTVEMAVAVICHEVGHAIGLPHLAVGNLMAPYLNMQISKPQAGDIAEAVARYGAAAVVPAPTPKPPPAPPPVTTVAPDVSGIITINGLPFVLVPRT